MTALLSVVRRVSKKLFPAQENAHELNIQVKGQQVSDLISKHIGSDKPCMIARLGATELSCAEQYVDSKPGLLKYLNYIKGDINHYKYSDDLKYRALNWSGIFPANKEVLDKFSRLMIEDMKDVDVLGSWLEKERKFETELAEAVRVPLQDLEPYYHKDPWSSTLKGKVVLVVHPFAQTITEQYGKRDLLFKNDILPPFELITYTPVQSIAGQATAFNSWFDALEHMKREIDRISFDVAILGCGAYGFPLAAHIKRSGKQAVHLGGATQILFGIKGRRWEEREFFQGLFNEHWVKPRPDETPQNFQRVEEGCYW